MPERGDCRGGEARRRPAQARDRAVHSETPPAARVGDRAALGPRSRPRRRERWAAAAAATAATATAAAAAAASAAAGERSHVSKEDNLGERSSLLDVRDPDAFVDSDEEDGWGTFSRDYSSGR
jgi:hypothetical protein